MTTSEKVKDHLLICSNLRTRHAFRHVAVPSPATMLDIPSSEYITKLSKYYSEYVMVKGTPASKTNQSRPQISNALQNPQSQLDPSSIASKNHAGSQALTPYSSAQPTAKTSEITHSSSFRNNMVAQTHRHTGRQLKPAWHSPWALKRVIQGHTGWVRAIAVDCSNEWFVTGGGDRLIKVWDLASGNLKLTLTGHVSSVRGLAISERSPYLFSAGEDKMIKCWDLETNKVIRHYHGHLSGIYSLALHPTIDILATGSRDSSIRLWDMRTKHQIHVLTGHSNTIGSLLMQASEYQLISSSHDSLIKLWDIRMGKCKGTLTHHKKSVRSLVSHPTEPTFVSGSADNVKQWAMLHESGVIPPSEFPSVRFVQNMSGHEGIVNCLSTNGDGVLFAGCDNGSMHFWDWKSGYLFQSMESQVQPGSLDSEAGVFASIFDRSGSRLITCEADKSIKVWAENLDANEHTHPIVWKQKLNCDRY